jgi:hypothetical protein
VRRWFEVLGPLGFRDFAHRQENGFVLGEICFVGTAATKQSLTAGRPGGLRRDPASRTMKQGK